MFNEIISKIGDGISELKNSRRTGGTVSYIDADGNEKEVERSNYTEDNSAVMKNDYNDYYEDYETDTRASSEKFLRFPEKNSRTHKVVRVKGTDFISKWFEASDHFKSGHAVYVNLDEANNDSKTRVLDFIGGAAYALDGRLERLSNTLYALVPNGDEIGGDLYEDTEYRFNNGYYN